MLLKDPEARRALFADAPDRYVHLLDLLDREPDAVSVYVDDEAHPANAVAVHWGGGPMNLSNVAEVRARRVRGLETVIDALPRGEGRYELVCPFWAAPALEQVFRAEVQGPVSRYVLRPGELRLHPAFKQAVPFEGEDVGMMGLVFPRFVPEAPHRALVVRGELAAVAVTTHVADGVARFGVHVVEEMRGRGFGSGVASALAAALIEAGLVPTAEVWLGDERSVRLVESLGLVQVDTLMRVTGAGRHA